MINKLDTFLYTNEMSHKARDVALKYFKIVFSTTVTFAIYETFLVLYVLQFVTFFELGIIMSIRFAIQALLDYPTGALADILGHKRVLIVAYIGHIGSVLTFLFSKNFEDMLIAYLISALAMSQESGALISWLDNRYTKYNNDRDPSKKTYGAFLGRTLTIRILTLGLSFVIGGVIADAYSRGILFIVHLVLLIWTLILLVQLLDVNLMEQESFSLATYTSQLTSGFSFINERPGLFFLFTGIAISNGAVWAIWANLMLFPTYESYARSDKVTGMIRSSIYVIGVVWSLLAASLSKRIDRVYRTSFLVNIIQGPVFYYFMWMYQKNYPPTDTFNIYLLLGLILVFQLIGLTMSLEEILLRRIMIDLIPDKLRNTIYSLLPSIITLVAIPFAFIGGWLITNVGFVFTIFFVACVTSMGTIVTGIGYYILADESSKLIINQQEIPTLVV